METYVSADQSEEQGISACRYLGWCPLLIYFSYESGKDGGFIRDICQTPKHLECSSSGIDPTDIIPEGCLCDKVCAQRECTKHPKLIVLESKWGAFGKCVCYYCTNFIHCFPVVTALGEERIFLSTLSNEKLCGLYAQLRALGDANRIDALRKAISDEAVARLQIQSDSTYQYALSYLE